MIRIGIGTPINHNSAHPTFPSSDLRLRRILTRSFQFFIFVYPVTVSRRVPGLTGTLGRYLPETPTSF